MKDLTLVVLLSCLSCSGLYGKEPRKSFVERASLLNRPLRTRMVGGVGAGG